MDLKQREALGELLRRVDEVRGLSGPSEHPLAVETPDIESLLQALDELVRELERSHRRLIETNVQLVSLREVAGSTVSALDGRETSRTVSRYLASAFGFEDVFVLLIDRETTELVGSWTHAEGERLKTHPLELSLAGDPGAIARAVWLNRTVVHGAARRHVTGLLPDGHPLEDIIAGLGSIAVTPLQRSHARASSARREGDCGPRCILGEAVSLVPPPGTEAEEWSVDREDRKRHCLACNAMPLLGVIGIARRPDAVPLGAADVTLLESIALSVAPVMENARLYQELRKSERFREHVLDSMASALAAVNMKGEILTFNRAAEELLGLPEAEVLGQPFGALFGTDGDTLLRETLEHARESVRVETLLRARDGSAVPVSLTTSLLRDDRRSVYGAIATFVDLTPLKRAEEHARRQDRLAALGRFTSSVAHEIRNPLAGIGAGVQYLARSLGDDGPQSENLNFILGEIRRLDRIVQDLFEVTHPRRMELTAAPIEDCVRRAHQSLASLLDERQIEFRLEAPKHSPVGGIL